MSTKTKILNVYCLNCKRHFTSREDRFPVCTCGNTIPIIDNEPFARLNINNSERSISIIEGSRETLYPISNVPDLIRTLPGLSFECDGDVANLLLSEMPLHRNAVFSYSASELFLHSFYYQNSNVYKWLFDNKRYKETKALLGGKKVPDIQCSEPIESIGSWSGYSPDSMSPEAIRFAIDYYLCGWKYNDAVNMIESGIPVVSFINVFAETKFTYDEIKRYIGELNKVCITGDEAIRNIVEFNALKTELETVIGTRFDEELPIHMNLHIARINMNLYRKLGMISYRHYLADFDNSYESYNCAGYLIKPLGVDDVKEFAIGSFPEETLSSPILGVYNNESKLLTMVAKTKGSLKVSGELNDGIRIALNEFFDKIYAKDGENN